jgi:hypothetical protein
MFAFLHLRLEIIYDEGREKAIIFANSVVKERFP